jgi:hypothetical protein
MNNAGDVRAMLRHRNLDLSVLKKQKVHGMHPTRSLVREAKSYRIKGNDLRDL